MTPRAHARRRACRSRPSSPTGCWSPPTAPTCGCSSARSRCSRCAAAASTATRSASSSPRSPARVPAGQRLQVVVEAEPLDVDARARRATGAQIDRRGRAARRGDRERGEAMRRLGYGLEQTDPAQRPGRRRPPRLRWTVATRWQPGRGAWRRCRARAARARAHAGAARARARRRRLAALHRRDRQRARPPPAASSTRSTAPQALAALARAVRPGATTPPASVRARCRGCSTPPTRRPRSRTATRCSRRSAAARELHVGARLARRTAPPASSRR